MAKRSSTKAELRGKARLRSEIVEATRGLHRIGAVSDAHLEKTTVKMLGRNALPKVTKMSPAEIVKVREATGVSQAVLAAFMNGGEHDQPMGTRRAASDGGGVKASSRRETERS